MESAGGVEENEVVAVLLGVFYRSLGNIDGVLRSHLEHGYVELLAYGFELLYGGGTVNVTGDEQRTLALLAHQRRKLCAVCGLTCALKSHEHNYARRLAAYRKALIFAAHEPHKLFVYDLDDLLRRRQRLKHVCAAGTLGHALCEVLYDLKADVRLQKRHTHFLHGFLDVRLGKSALASELLKGSGQLV